MFEVTELTYVLISTALVFAFLIIGAFIKSQKLKNKNKKLMDSIGSLEEEEENISSGHLYSSSKKS